MCHASFMQSGYDSYLVLASNVMIDGPLRFSWGVILSQGDGAGWGAIGLADGKALTPMQIPP